MSDKLRYIENNGNTRILSVDSTNTTLLPRNYAVTFNPMAGYSLNHRESLDLPPKIYGKSGFPDRVLSTWEKLGKGMGVLLSGPKGTGKTVEAKSICVKSNKPVIFVTAGYADAGFQEFIESIKTPSVIFIDEFEKIYFDEDARNFFLSIMDGVAKSRHLFVLTSNNSNIGEFFNSRPGRVRYHKQYDFLDDEILKAIIKDKLVNQNNFDAIWQSLTPLPNLSMDSLICILDECNMYDEVPKDFMGFFNVKPERPTSYNVTLKTMQVKPKEGISREEQRLVEATSYERNEDEDGNGIVDNDILKRLADVTPITYKSSYADPFGHNGDDNGVYVSYMYSDDVKASTRTINWKEHQMKSFKQDRKGFVAVHKNGDVLTGVQVKPRIFDFN